MENKYNLYDNIVGATYTNIAIHSVNKKEIALVFNKDSYTHKVFLKVALLVANFENKKLYIKCKFFDFLKILFYYYSIEEIIRGKSRLRFRRRESSSCLDIDTIAAFEAKEFFTDIGIFEEIWKEYYEK